LNRRMKFLEDKTEQQSFLFSKGYRDLVPREDEIWAYLRLFEGFDLSKFEKKYSGEGQVPVDPKVMLRTIFYALQKGIVSVRKLSEACIYDLRFIILSGALSPDRRTWDRFFVRHEEALGLFFKQITEKAVNLGLVGFEQLAVDGTRLKGNTKAHGMSYEKMTRAKEHIAENLKKLRGDAEKESLREEAEAKVASEEKRVEKMDRAQSQIELEDKAMLSTSKSRNPMGDRKKSLNDPEAMEMSFKGSSKAYMFGYNAQIAVDAKAQIILGAGLHDKVTDYGGLKEMLDQTKANTDKQARQILCDLGYVSVANICMVYENEMEPIFATERNFEYEADSKAELKTYEQFSLDKESERFSCLAGHPLNYASRKEDRFVVSRPKQCTNCPMQADCLFYKSGAKTASTPIAKYFYRILEHRKASQSEEYKASYRKRKTIVEPVFGNIKHNKRFVINAVGKAKVRLRFLCACMAHNLEKILHSGLSDLKPIMNQIFCFLTSFDSVFLGAPSPSLIFCTHCDFIDFL